MRPKTLSHACLLALTVMACGTEKSGTVSGAGGLLGVAGMQLESGRASQGGVGGVGAASSNACAPELEQSGEATFYTFADGSGNCSFDATPNDLMVGAMNAIDYAESAVCGACLRIVGPNGNVTVRTVDQCPECAKGDIDLSPQAFDRIAARSAGRVPIRWSYVACADPGPLVYHFKEGANQWWTAVQVRDSRYRISKFEYERSGAFIAVQRESYNYFVEPNGMGPGPYTFRVTDVYGRSVVDRGIMFKEASNVAGTQQFETCAAR